MSDEMLKQSLANPIDVPLPIDVETGQRRSANALRLQLTRAAIGYLDSLDERFDGRPVASLDAVRRVDVAILPTEASEDEQEVAAQFKIGPDYSVVICEAPQVGDEGWLWKNEAALTSVRCGLQQLMNGKVTSGPKKPSAEQS